MNYVSTRGGIDPVGFSDAVMMGLARDGGLLLPRSLPDVRDRLDAWRRLSYPDLAFELMRLFVDLPDDALRPMVARSYGVFRHPEVTPVVPVGGVHVLELFHGPTLAFKDVALQFLGNLFECLLGKSSRHMNIVAATSGDTGSAAIEGVRGRERIRIFVLHPHGRVSPVQERQMTSVLDDNVFNIAVDGTFDDCQGLVKAVFSDLEFRDRHALGAVNSINWARVLAQIVYYFYGAFRVMDRTGSRRVRFAVPTGNFGDILAGYLAARMGLPIGRLVLATNENDILSRFFNSGVYSLGRVVETLSPSMDIQVASNFERYLYYRAGEDPRRLKAMMDQFAAAGRLDAGRGPDGVVDRLFAAGVGDMEATLRAIRRFQENHGYLLDPHTAVGVHVAARWMDPAEPMICLATAHPAKFGDAIRRACGRDLARHPSIDRLEGLPVRRDRLPASVSALRDYLAARIPEG